jgi:hypothetical protein
MSLTRQAAHERSRRSGPPPAPVIDSASDHLFISYAWEDAAFAEWLALKLTALGYAVWCDRFQLLGGESYPRDIDRAIKERTFRVLGLLSHASISKPNPVKERTLALSLGRERQLDFLIPLNVDGLRPSELDWMESDLTFIPFHQSWHEGLTALLKKLQAIDAPRPMAGSTAISDWFASTTNLVVKAEQLWSNLFEIVELPEEIYWVTAPTGLPAGWPAYDENDGVWLLELPDALAFDFIRPESIELERLRPEDPARRALANLLRQYLRRRCHELGLIETETGQLFFPPGLLPGDRLPFTHHTGRQASLQVVGSKSFRAGEKTVRNQHHLIVDFAPRLDRFGAPTIELRIRIHVTGLGGQALSAKLANRRRKRIAKSWFNHQWWSRQAAVARWFSQGDETISLGIGSARIVMRGQPAALPVNVGIDEDFNDGETEPDLYDEDADPEGEEGQA